MNAEKATGDLRLWANKESLFGYRHINGSPVRTDAVTSADNSGDNITFHVNAINVYWTKSLDYDLGHNAPDFHMNNPSYC